MVRKIIQKLISQCAVININHLHFDLTSRGVKFHLKEKATMIMHKHKNTENTEINVTPLLDVVFIILIFFIVTTSFTKHKGLQVFSQKKWSIENNKVDMVSIELNNNKHVNINGQSTKINNLGSILADLKASNPHITAQVIAAEDVSTGTLVETIDHVNYHGIKLLSINSH